MNKPRMSAEEMIGVLQQIADTDWLEHYLSRYEEQALEILVAEGAPTEYAPELINFQGLSERGRDARKVLTAAAAVRKCRHDGNLEWAAIQAMAVVTAATRAHMRLFEPDVELGQKRRVQFSEMANSHARQVQQERHAEWRRWNEADRLLVAENPALAKSKASRARLVKKKLGLPDSVRTIRDRLENI